MLNESKLESRHKSLSEKVTKLEKERGYNRDFKHKSRLIDLKKEKLKIKDKLLSNPEKAVTSVK
jgi:uncharacterized protein YdcH (DUF465 family)